MVAENTVETHASATARAAQVPIPPVQHGTTISFEKNLAHLKDTVRRLLGVLAVLDEYQDVGTKHGAAVVVLQLVLSRGGLLWKLSLPLHHNGGAISMFDSMTLSVDLAIRLTVRHMEMMTRQPEFEKRSVRSR